jgi:hypothetical protein
MTTEPTREPTGDESSVDATPPTEASAEQLAEAEAMAAAEAAAISAADADAISAAGASAPSPESGAEMTAATGVAPAPAPPLSETAALTPAIDPAVPAKPRRRTVFLATTRRVLSFAFGVALFVGGIAIGISAFQANRPLPLVTETLRLGAAPPPVAQEFITALAANDADALRSSLDIQPHKDITGEMTRFGIQRVHRVQTLGTQVDGTRSATEIMMMAENVDGLPFAVNLVILVDGGKIEGFR